MRLEATAEPWAPDFAAGTGTVLLMPRYIAKLLFGVGFLDPVVFTAGALFLLAVSSLASYLPARRASRVDPMVALKYD